MKYLKPIFWAVMKAARLFQWVIDLLREFLSFEPRRK